MGQNQGDADDDLDRAAQSLSDRNHPEDAWFLRGVWDALNGEGPNGEGLYQTQYTAGFDSVMVAVEEGYLDA